MIGYFFLVNLKKITQYKTDFLIGIIPHVVLQAIDLLFIKTIFSSVGTVRGWHTDELFLIYGLFTLNFGFFSLIFGNLNNTKYYLFSGEFDVMRLRPISSILHIMLSSFKTQALEQILAGCIITRYAFSSLEINVGLSEIIAFVIFRSFDTWKPGHYLNFNTINYKWHILIINDNFRIQRISQVPNRYICKTN